MAETSRQLLDEITGLCHRLAGEPDAVLAEFFSDLRGTHDDLADIADEVHVHSESRR